MKIQNFHDYKLKFNFKVMQADSSIIWTGDLQDDCTAIWNGLILRAEWMQGKIWWWAVSTNNSNSSDEIDSSNNYASKCRSGESARQLAEAAAINFIKSKL